MTIILIIALLSAAFYGLYYSFVKPSLTRKKLLKEPFPTKFRTILEERVRYYRHLPEDRKKEFEKRITMFLAEKDINGVDTEISDTDKLLVASSAIIPLFAFPYYNYPRIKEILLYPGSFDENFQTANTVQGRSIIGMVGNGFMTGTIILSRPDLEASFDGRRHKSNVGIHEFVHLIDGADGKTDGIPEILFQHSFVFPWLKEIKREMEKIENNHSDINPYALTNNAEFLAVVAEYFFDNPEKLKSHHPELYKDLVKIFSQNPEKSIQENIKTSN